MRIGRKIYYDNITGVPIIDTGQWDNAISDTTIEEDVSNYTVLTERNRDSFDVLTLDYGQYQQDFAICNSFVVEPLTKELKFSYPDPMDPDPQQPLTEQVDELKLAVAELTMMIATPQV